MNGPDLGKALAALRKPANMKRGDAAYYAALAKRPCAPGKKRGRPPSKQKPPG